MPGRSRVYVAGAVPDMAANWAPRPLAATLLIRAPVKHRLAPVVVCEPFLALLLLAERDVEIEVEVSAKEAPKGTSHRRSYAWGFAKGARDTSQSIASWLARCTGDPVRAR